MHLAEIPASAPTFPYLGCLRATGITSVSAHRFHPACQCFRWLGCYLLPLPGLPEELVTHGA
eukprot:7180511-Prorocentrum_lima.AAC.1